MLIGRDFNSRSKQLLEMIGEFSNLKPDAKVAAEDLVAKLDLDRTELKNLLGYLESKELIEVVTIGGPYLYGHIKITEKGILKLTEMK